MTYIDIINNILRRLRETTVSTLSDDYVLMIGDYVNDAVIFVESAWAWSHLRDTTEVMLTPGQKEYTLTNTSEYDIITNIYSEASLSDLIEITPQRMKYYARRENQNSGVSSSNPYYWSYVNSTTPGEMNIAFHPTPEVMSDVFIDRIIRSPRLVDEQDIIRVPAQPVIYLALAYAARERGEVQGQPVAELFALADKYLSDAIALDADKYPAETTYVTV